MSESAFNGIRLVSNYLRLTEVASPPAPPTGFVYVYVKADGILYFMDDTGTETAAGGGSGSGLTHPQIMARGVFSGPF